MFFCYRFHFFFFNCLLLFLWCQFLLVWPCIICSTFISSLYKLVYFSFFTACFCMVSLSACIITSTSVCVCVCVFSVLFLIIYNCCIRHCFHLITVDATNVIGILHSFGYRASSQLSVSMDDRNSANHEKSWLTQKCRSTKYQRKLLCYNDRVFSNCGILGFDAMLS